MKSQGPCDRNPGQRMSFILLGQMEEVGPVAFEVFPSPEEKILPKPRLLSNTRRTWRLSLWDPLAGRSQTAEKLSQSWFSHTSCMVILFCISHEINVPAGMPRWTFLLWVYTSNGGNLILNSKHRSNILLKASAMVVLLILLLCMLFQET